MQKWVDEETFIWYIIPMDMHMVITTQEELAKVLTLTDAELRWFSLHTHSLPLRISRYYLSLINPDDPCDPLRRQVIPSIEEEIGINDESLDPLAEISHSVFPRLVHRYENRVAFLVTDRCATYCRHCFRRRFTAGELSRASDAEVKEIADYIAAHREVKEMLLTGGDPLMLSDVQLEKLLSTLRSARSDLVLRLCTRMPATFPMRITDSLITIISHYTQPALYVMTQFNHDREITKESIAAVNRFVDAGIPVMNQTVLLRKVNDNVDTLERLMNALVAIRVKPYYLFQGDLVGGTAHLRVPLESGLTLERELRKRLSGLAMPTYAIDLPEGGGKVPLGTSYLKGKDAQGSWVFSTVDGEVRTYPDPKK